MPKKIKAAVWKDPTVLARLVVVILAVTAVFLLARVLAGVALGAAAYYDETTAHLSGPQLIQASIDLLGVLVVLSWLVIPFWIFRIAKNAHTLGRGMEHSAASALWWYLIPFLSLFMPYKVMREVWDVSASSAEDRAAHRILIVWWLFHVLAGIVVIPALKLAEQLPALDRLSDLLYLASSMTFLLVVRQLTSMQKATHALQQTDGVWD